LRCDFAEGLGAAARRLAGHDTLAAVT